MRDITIKAEGLGKAYRIGAAETRSKTFAHAAASWVTKPLKNFRSLSSLNTSAEQGGENLVWALRDISFEIRKGEVVGFVGRNGSGKSTLLKILSGVTSPTEGRAVLSGRVSSLLEVGTGFHPELSGRENIYMNGTILGMMRSEIDRKFDEIVAFSGVERFLDTPVKRYSSGMKVRLGFSVAAHLEPEILIVDEVLAVGDAEFQKRCLGKMEDVANSGRTVLFVSHNMGAVQNLCTRAIALHYGAFVDEGAPEEVIQNYLARTVPQSANGFATDNPERLTTSSLRLTNGRIRNAAGDPVSHLNAGDEARFEFDYENPDDHDRLTFVVEIANDRGIVVYYLNADHAGAVLTGQRYGRVSCTIPKLGLPIGHYTVRTVIKSRGDEKDKIPAALSFNVIGSTWNRGGMGPTTRLCAALTECEWESSALPDLEGVA